MKTIFDNTTRDELIARIRNLREDSRGQWGKMNVYQMAKHCTIWNEWVLGIPGFVYKQEFLGKVFGRMALRMNTKNDKPMGKNMPAGKGFTVKDESGNLPAEKDKWVVQIRNFADYSNPAFVHDFFGKMTNEQIGIFSYKHNDHHLRQFCV